MVKSAPLRLKQKYVIIKRQVSLVWMLPENNCVVRYLTGFYSLYQICSCTANGIHSGYSHYKSFGACYRNSCWAELPTFKAV